MNTLEVTMKKRVVLRLLLFTQILTFIVGTVWLLFRGKDTVENNLQFNNEERIKEINKIRLSIRHNFKEEEYLWVKPDVFSNVNLSIIHNIKFNIDEEIENSFEIISNVYNSSRSSSKNREHLIEKLLYDRALLKKTIEKFFFYKTWNTLDNNGTELSPFDYLSIPIDYFLQHPTQYEKTLSNENSYMLRYRHTSTIINNEYSEILQKLAIGLVGQECFNKKLVFFGESGGFFHPGGPRKVGIGISNVLKLIGKQFTFISSVKGNEDVLGEADLIYSYQPHLSTEITFDLLTRFLKPKLFIGPCIAPYMIRDDYLVLNDRLTYIAASPWVKYSDYSLTVPGLKIMVHPTTIHTTIWSPRFDELLLSNSNIKKTRNEILFYNKYCKYNADVVEKKLRDVLSKEQDFKKITIRTIEYGKYTENEFWKILREDIQFALICAGTETQGIAIEEIMSMNIPVFAIWEVDEPSPYTLTVVPYFEEGVSGMVSKPEDISIKLPVFLRKAMRGEFKPREMIVSNTLFSDGKSELTQSSSLISSNGQYRLTLESSTFILFNHPSGTAIQTVARFSSAKDSVVLRMQSTGVIAVLETSSSKVLWSAGTAGSGESPYRFIVQSDRNVVLYDSVGRALWALGSNSGSTTNDVLFGGLECNVPKCNGILATETTTVCSGKGVCSSPNNCTCNKGRIGAFCELQACGGIAATDTTNVCSGRGTCLVGDICSCNNGDSVGDYCQIPKCIGILANDTLNVCSGRGVCSSPNNCTNCTGGYHGTNCELFSCFGFNSNDKQNVCSGNGDCVAKDKCICKSGYYGNDCKKVQCYDSQLGRDGKMINSYVNRLCDKINAVLLQNN
ncbi:hypothetical protein ABK040_004031 [Willaertia magna]